MRLRRTLALGVTAAGAIAPTVVPTMPTLPALPALTQEARAEQATTVRTAASSGAGESTRGPARGPARGPTREPRCGDVSDRDFPIEARIHGGPAGFRPGGGPGTWFLDLTNTTDADCRYIHPVVVLADRDRTLAVSQVTLQIRPATSGDGGRWRTLSLEKTDEDEIVGVLNDGFPGFVVPEGRTVTVSARLAFAADARPNRVVMSAATVQRRGRDGDWVGESNTYDFAVGSGGVNGDRATSDKEVADNEKGHREKGHREKGHKEKRADAPPELARAGTGNDLIGRIAAATALVTAGVVLVVGVRRLRTGRP
ncbi:hypothetical protein [Streptomyces sp. 35G-GA-8]|uniref:hypothetical protein n=1 Tax=Streptomyces sp. 35G-GA-8 TaxID=2939434 RepID=UPI00201ED9D7|nr:hypothetical protein [Streptomyces sp. 35G-GA-8]MCL7381377.1 hypothetical protein [Streptomyces sp. 35G-GA-8]